MQQTSTSSFFKFVLGLLVFIGLSFGITIAVNDYAMSQQQTQSAAAAQAAMLQQEK